MDKGSADDQDSKPRRIFIIVGLLTLAAAIALTVAWVMLLGYGAVALFDLITTGPAGAVPR